MMAASGGNLELVKYFIGKGAQVNERAPIGFTPLIAAISARKSNIVFYLLKLGADPNAELTWGRSKVNALLLAADTGSIEIANMLMGKGARMFDVKSREAAHILVRLAHRGRFEMTEFMLSRGVPVNSRDPKGNTPLIRAVETSRMEVVKLLLQRGADPRLKNESGISAHIMAGSVGNAKVIRMLKQAGR